MICGSQKIITMTATEISKIYDTELSIPGMSDKVKIELGTPGKNVFVLAKVIERGLSANKDDTPNSVLNVVNEEMLQELNTMSEELLKKAGLTDMNEKLNALK